MFQNILVVFTVLFLSTAELQRIGIVAAFYYTCFEIVDSTPFIHYRKSYLTDVCASKLPNYIKLCYSLCRGILLSYDILFLRFGLSAKLCYIALVQERALGFRGTFKGLLTNIPLETLMISRRKIQKHYTRVSIIIEMQPLQLANLFMRYISNVPQHLIETSFHVD